MQTEATTGDEGRDRFLNNKGATEAQRRRGVTSAVRLHDATNANLSMLHEVAKQAATQVALREVDKECL